MASEEYLLKNPRLAFPSSPPAEYAHIYKQISDEGSLTDGDDAEELESEEDEQSQPSPLLSRPASKGREEGVFTTLEADVSSELEVTHPSNRQTMSGHATGEQLSGQATANRSPVFTKAQVGRGDLTAENLHRYAEQPQPSEGNSNEAGPSLNVPRTWGSRASKSREWLRSMNSAEEAPEDGNLATSNMDSKVTTDSNEQPTSAPESSPGRGNQQSRIPVGEHRLNKRARTTSPEKGYRSGVRDNQDEKDTPDAPTIGYRTSTFNKPSPTKRDSQQLLRKLSRSHSPRHSQTEEARTPEPANSKIYDKTPVVTGAWVDTPVTERPAELPDHSKHQNNNSSQYIQPQRSSQQGESSNSEKAELDTKPNPEPRVPRGKRKRELEKPNLPKSALATVMEAHNTGEGSLAMGDDTVESLQMMLGEKPMAVKAEDEEDAASDKTVQGKRESAETQGNDPSLANMGQTLTLLSQSINEVKVGLNSLGNQVSQIGQGLFLEPSPQNPGNHRHLHKGETCGACGSYSDGLVYGSVPLPRLWRRDRISRSIRLTTVGLCSVIILFWLFSELAMCECYCHPRFARVCKGNCLMPDAPRFPFVIPTMLWRWSNLSAILSPLFTIIIASFKLVAQILGLWDGYVDDDPPPLNLTGVVRINGQVTSFPTAAATPDHHYIRNLWGSRGKGHDTDQEVPIMNLHQVDSQPSMEEDEYLS